MPHLLTAPDEFIRRVAKKISEEYTAEELQDNEMKCEVLNLPATSPMEALLVLIDLTNTYNPDGS
jgi:hypothetical protein